MRKPVTLTLAVVACFTLLFSPLNEAKAQAAPVDPQTAARLQATLDSLLTAHNVKGLSASVIIPGKGTWKGVSGISHVGVPIDTAMVFAMGPVTQNLTAAAILLLQEDSLLSIDDPIHFYLSAYPNVNPNTTIRQLLQHTSGIFNYFAHPTWYTAVNNSPWQALTPSFVLNNCLYAPVAAPGATFDFSHTNYLLLGLIIEQVSGQSCASFFRQRLLDPLQLTSLYAGEHEPATGVIPHHWSPAAAAGSGTDLSAIPMTAILATSPAAVAMFGTPYDLARWSRLLFTGQVLQDTSLQLMKQFLTVIGGLSNGFGLGLKRYEAGNVQAWGHHGNIRGYSSCLLFSPSDSIAVSVSSNQPSVSEDLAWSLLTIAQQQLFSSAPGETDVLQDALTCFPNPVQWKGSIRYTLQKAQPVEITLQNSLGQTVQTLLSQPQQAGEHSLTIDTGTLPAGMYFCTLQTAGSRLVQRWVVTQ